MSQKFVEPPYSTSNLNSVADNEFPSIEDNKIKHQKRKRRGEVKTQSKLKENKINGPISLLSASGKNNPIHQVKITPHNINSNQ